jgi:Domain of unknown function (DUF3883)
MALNTWWMSDPAQRYWMEITHRDDLGVDLNAPKLPEGQWTYDLVSQVQPGDRVLHWHSGAAEPALVGWSEATEPPTTVPEYTWQPRGTSGRGLPGPRTSEGWVLPLGGVTWFSDPPTLAVLTPLLDTLMELNTRLEAEHGKPTYFPFIRYRENEIRARQGYLAKFPVPLFDLIPGIASARIAESIGSSLVDVDIPEDYQPRRAVAPSGRTTRAQDPELRSAVENRAVDVALEYYERIGGTNPRILGKPYDIAITLNNVERHCEVKGSSMVIDTVELTINEVDHANGYGSVDLIVVDGIDVTRDRSTGEIYTDGGRCRVWMDWSPSDEALKIKKYAYSLPPDEQVLSTESEDW